MVGSAGGGHAAEVVQVPVHVPVLVPVQLPVHVPVLVPVQLPVLVPVLVWAVRTRPAGEFSGAAQPPTTLLR